MQQIDLREGARRQHRRIGLYAVLQCWHRKLDGVAFSRSHLSRLIGLRRFKGTRIEWLRKDLAEFFPYSSTFYSTDTESFSSIFVSRRPLAGTLPMGELSSIERIRRMGSKGPRLAVFEMWPSRSFAERSRISEALLPIVDGNRDERILASVLGLACDGQLAVRDLSGMTAPRLPKRGSI